MRGVQQQRISAHRHRCKGEDRQVDEIGGWHDVGSNRLAGAAPGATSEWRTLQFELSADQAEPQPRWRQDLGAACQRRRLAFQSLLLRPACRWHAAEGALRTAAGPQIESMDCVTPDRRYPSHEL